MTAFMTAGIVVPLVVIPVAVIAVFVWYRQKMASMRADGSTREMPGARLTAETLRRLPHPPWRVVYEIRPSLLEGADHVVIGPCGIVALTTYVADRPTGEVERVSATVARPGIVRAAVDVHTEPWGVRCDRVVKVYWGTPRPELPAAREGTNGVIEVEGQRLEAWLHSLPPGPLPPAQVDAAWRAVVVGLDRPDPLAAARG